MPKVMLVDDDRTTVSLLKMLLELDGFAVQIAEQGQLALDKANAEHPDLFMLDFHLSDMDGVTLVKTLRSMPAFTKTPIVVASGLNVSDEAMRAGASLFLIKPFEPGDLATLFRNLISGATSNGPDRKR
ncbi:MAG TPA: response regulator [Aggregatilineales bacterium]|nr:response regulator [Aggregatilineales bacterium]